MILNDKTREAIEQAAYFAWINAGRPDGQTERFWRLGQESWMDNNVYYELYAWGEWCDNELAETFPTLEMAEDYARDLELDNFIISTMEPSPAPQPVLQTPPNYGGITFEFTPWEINIPMINLTV
jgi:hypothetical protein